MTNNTPQNNSQRIAWLTLVVGVVALIPACLGSLSSWLPLLSDSNSDKFSPSKPNTCTYTGFVLDEDTKKGIADAEVTLDYQSYSETDYTKSNGKYRFEIPCEIEDSLADIKVEAENYEPYPYSGEVRLLDASEQIRLKLKNPNNQNNDSEPSESLSQTSNSCLLAEIVSPKGAENPQNASAFLVQNPLNLEWEPSDCEMTVKYYQNAVRHDVFTPDEPINIKEPGKTEIKIWDKKSGQIADQIWVQVE